ncbi:ead/Ea22-like family protein [Enterobacter hormaechei subsp. oharae]|uniref:ead/Ea22-like family protein n=1 Tax=Enterobacter hormaechei TaxID=158836 RepID=UPI0039C9788A
MSNIDKRPYRADGGDISTGRLKEIADNPYGDEEKCWLAKRVIALQAELEAKDKRIAELEARAIKPVNGEVLVTVAGFTGCGKSAIAGEIEIAMKAIGVPVQWANGDAEKRMTGADWLTAIELYKPCVRIIEVNVPNAAAAGKGEAS